MKPTILSRRLKDKNENTPQGNLDQAVNQNLEEEVNPGHAQDPGEGHGEHSVWCFLLLSTVLHNSVRKLLERETEEWG